MTLPNPLVLCAPFSSHLKLTGPSSVKITLSLDNPESQAMPFPRRELVLDPENKSIVIGRASKAETKGLVSSPNNAWFLSPVMSRQHAEIVANLEQKVGYFFYISSASYWANVLNRKSLSRTLAPYTVHMSMARRISSRKTNFVNFGTAIDSSSVSRSFEESTLSLQPHSTSISNTARRSKLPSQHARLANQADKCTEPSAPRRHSRSRIARMSRKITAATLILMSKKSPNWSHELQLYLSQRLDPLT